MTPASAVQGVSCKLRTRCDTHDCCRSLQVDLVLVGGIDRYDVCDRLLLAKDPNRISGFDGVEIVFGVISEVRECCDRDQVQVRRLCPAKLGVVVAALADAASRVSETRAI